MTDCPTCGGRLQFVNSHLTEEMDCQQCDRRFLTDNLTIQVYTGEPVPGNRRYRCIECDETTHDYTRARAHTHR